MKCESCNVSEVEVEERIALSQTPYKLCKPCHHRLLNYALRPREFFNLTAIHGHDGYLLDDFYDWDTGEAMQPHTDVTDAHQFPFPRLEQVKNDLHLLIDFACVQYFATDEVMLALQNIDKQIVLARLKEKVNYNRAINYKAYEIAANVLGSAAGEWIHSEWQNRHPGEIQIFAEALASCLDFDVAFNLLIHELEHGDNAFLSENVSALAYFKSEKVLDWIERVSGRITHISSGWGLVAASSAFSWKRATKWLAQGRPLSLIALDGLYYCTSMGDRHNQAFWLRKYNPRLADIPPPEEVAQRLQDYLKEDAVPRTKNVVEKIIQNVFEARV